MKPILSLVLACFVFVNTNVYGQMEIRPFVGGIKSSIENSDQLEFEEDWGVNFGVDVMFGKRFYFQPGLHYSGTKSDVEPKGGVNGEETEIKISNFTIPALVGYKLFDPETDRVFNLRLYTGPSLSFVTSVDDDESQLDIDKEDFKRATFGWNAGVGLDFLFAFLDVGYRFGMSDTFDDFEIQGVDIDNSRSHQLFANLGIRIRF